MAHASSKALLQVLIDALLRGESIDPHGWYCVANSHNLAQRAKEARDWFKGLGVEVENVGVGGLRTHNTRHAIYRIRPDQLTLARQLAGF